MTRIWYCANCGYEIGSRGRCHLCRQKLVASQLPELAAGPDQDEVGYRLDDWSDRDRGRLIEELNELEILHRFEDDELVVEAEDESRVDDLLASVVSTTSGTPSGEEAGGSGEAGSDADGGPGFADESLEADPLAPALHMLASAAGRLRDDPTDMHADADVAEASASIFAADSHAGADDETWSAIGRVTRRLLAVLGAEEALEDDIRREASVLYKLLTPVIGDAEAGARGLEATDESDQTVYELPDWLPEQRAQLATLLDEAGIFHEWEHDELIVPAERESEVEALFAQVGVDDEDDDDGGESRYQAVAELFAASGRLAADPTDEDRAAAVVHWIEESEGPPLLGMDEVDWLMIMTRARALSGSIETDAGTDLVREEASTLHELLRKVV